MDLRGYCYLLLRRWQVLVYTVLIVGVPLAVAGVLMPPTYTATVRVVFSPNVPTDTRMDFRRDAGQYLTERMQTYAQAVTTNEVLQPVIDALGLEDGVPELVERLDISIPSDTSVIKISVSAPTAEEAASIANRISNQMPWAVADLEGAPTVEDSPIAVSALQPADVPQRRTTPNRKMNLAVAAGLALGAGVFAAVLADNFDTRVRRRRDVTALNLPYLGGIPIVRDRLARELLSFAEQPAPLRTVLHGIAIDLLYGAGQKPACLLFTSCRVGAGTTMAAANVAGALAEAGNRVVYIDADVRGGRLAAQLGIQQSRGITDLASGAIDLDESVLDREWGGFTIIPCGGSAIDIGEMLAGERFAYLLRALSTWFDVIVVDAPTITNLSDASRFTQNIPNVVLVAEAARTRRTELARVADSFRNSGANVLGVVLSRVRKQEPPAPADGSRIDKGKQAK